MLCPCRVKDSVQKQYADCCEPAITGKKPSDTAEGLMRSRYTAYVVKNMDYIDETQTHEKGEEFDKNEALKWAEGSEWLGLEVVKTTRGGSQDKDGVVEFIAHYKDKASGHELAHHETSLFIKAADGWKFKEGQIKGAGPVKRIEPKIGRNDPCSCGSGKKYKKCCGA